MKTVQMRDWGSFGLSILLPRGRKDKGGPIGFAMEAAMKDGRSEPRYCVSHKRITNGMVRYVPRIMLESITCLKPASKMMLLIPWAHIGDC